MAAGAEVLHCLAAPRRHGYKVPGDGAIYRAPLRVNSIIQKYITNLRYVQGALAASGAGHHPRLLPYTKIKSISKHLGLWRSLRVSVESGGGALLASDQVTLSGTRCGITLQHKLRQTRHSSRHAREAASGHHPTTRGQTRDEERHKTRGRGRRHLLWHLWDGSEGDLRSSDPPGSRREQTACWNLCRCWGPGAALCL